MTGSVDDAARTRRTTYLVLAVAFLLDLNLSRLGHSAADFGDASMRERVRDLRAAEHVMFAAAAHVTFHA